MMVEPSADTFLPTMRLVQAKASATAAAMQTTARVNLLIFIIDIFINREFIFYIYHFYHTKRYWRVVTLPQPSVTLITSTWRPPFFT